MYERLFVFSHCFKLICLLPLSPSIRMLFMILKNLRHFIYNNQTLLKTKNRTNNNNLISCHQMITCVRLYSQFYEYCYLLFLLKLSNTSTHIYIYIYILSSFICTCIYLVLLYMYMYIFSPPKQVHIHVAAVIIVINKDVIIIFGNFVFLWTEI